MSLRPGARLEDGQLHNRDHSLWSRRDFLTRLGLSTLGTGLLLNRTPVQALESVSPLAKLAATSGERILVLLQLSGGSDGLNNLIQYENDTYHRARPNLALGKDQVLKIGDQLGFHPAFEPLQPLWQEGKMAAVHSVGYAEPVLSHFRSKDIWDSASDPDDYLSTGWVGRYLDNFGPGDNTQLEKPLAVQIGGNSPLLFQGDGPNMSLAVNNLNTFRRLARNGQFFPTETLPPTTAGKELAFVRQLANDSFHFAGAVQTAAELGTNTIDFAPSQGLGANLAIVSRLIKGNLGARIYLVRISGFDTHSNQLPAQANLLRSLAQGVSDFYRDLAADKRSGDVVMMTFSEFGRRLAENASSGTDHGTAAPVFLFGDGISGGLFGTAPNLDDLDERGNIRHQTEFRQLYASLFEDWFGLDPSVSQGILGGNFAKINFIDASFPDRSTAIASTSETPSGHSLKQNYPNPFNPTTHIEYTLPHPLKVRLTVHNAIGQKVKTLVNRSMGPGRHTAVFNAAQLPSGVYFYRLKAGNFHARRKMLLQK